VYGEPLPRPIDTSHVTLLKSPPRPECTRISQNGIRADPGAGTALLLCKDRRLEWHGRVACPKARPTRPQLSALASPPPLSLSLALSLSPTADPAPRCIAPPAPSRSRAGSNHLRSLNLIAHVGAFATQPVPIHTPSVERAGRSPTCHPPCAVYPYARVEHGHHPGGRRERPPACRQKAPSLA